jgi:hypothetical protein
MYVTNLELLQNFARLLSTTTTGNEVNSQNLHEWACSKIGFYKKCFFHRKLLKLKLKKSEKLDEEGATPWLGSS